MYRSFGITVKELLNLDILKDAKVLSGEDGLDRRITKVNVMEVPDILDWVGAGEFLLTTAYSIKDNIDKLSELIPKLNEKGISGLGIKTKRYIKEIPKEIIITANNLNFPLIEIPYNISHSEILMPALTEIINTQANIIFKIDNLHNLLMKVMLSGGSLNEIAGAIHESIGNSLAIKENIFDTYVILSDEDIRPEIEDIILSECNQRKINKSHGRNKNTYFKVKDSINGKRIERILIPICTKDRNYGWIFIWEDKKPLTSIELTIIESTISVIALDLQKKLSIFEIESKHKIEFFDDLFSSEENRQKKAIERASFFSFDKTLSYAVIIISIKNSDKLIMYTPNNTDFLHQLNATLLSIIGRLAKFRREKIIYGNKSDHLIVLFGSESCKSYEKIKEETTDFCEEILSYAEIESIRDNISIGIGRNYENYNELWKSYKEANRASENLNGNNSGHPIHYDDLGIYRILAYKELQPELVQFYKEMLEPLVNYDRDKSTDLVKTLKKYFDCGGNLKRISEEMYAHYNTIIYRMQRIREIIGTDLDNSNDRLNIQIALKILDMVKNELVDENN